MSGSDDSGTSPTSPEDGDLPPKSSASTIDRVLGHAISTPQSMKLPPLPPSPPNKFKSRSSRYKYLYN